MNPQNLLGSGLYLFNVLTSAHFSDVLDLLSLATKSLKWSHVTKDFDQCHKTLYISANLDQINYQQHDQK